MVELRPYQSDLVAGIRASFASNRRVLGVAPTGAGKTVTFSYITSGARDKGNRVYVVAHRAEIVEQISDALDAMGVRHGRIQPGHTMTDDLVQVAMVQTLARRLDRVPAPALLVVDEAHHGIAGTWSTVCAAWPRAKILGVTATPQRLDGRGLREAFDDIVIGPGMAELIEGGFLAKYRYLAPPQEVDYSQVKTRLGDYAIDELAAVMDKPVITGSAVGHYRGHMNGRPAIAFCVTVEHAEHVAEQFRVSGFRAASVDGSMTRQERRDRIAGIGDGRYQVLTSCELISEGVDVPVIAGAILLRPTKSLGMFLQQVGRALRVKPDGGDAVILDHVGNVHRHGMPDAPREWSLDAKKKRAAAPPTTTCEQCYRVFASMPGWKDTAKCAQPDQPVGCILTPVDDVVGKKDPPTVVPGVLTEISTVAAWSAGMDIVHTPLKLLLPWAKTEAQLKEIAKARGYHHRWVKHILAGRRQHEPVVAFKPTTKPEPADELAGLMSA